MNKKRNDNFTYGIRLLAGAYLIYLTYDIITTSITEGDTLPIYIIIACVLFVIVGVLLIIMSALYFLKHKNQPDTKTTETNSGSPKNITSKEVNKNSQETNTSDKEL